MKGSKGIYVKKLLVPTQKTANSNSGSKGIYVKKLRAIPDERKILIFFYLSQISWQFIQYISKNRVFQEREVSLFLEFSIY